jgi:hypothetical protein
MKSYFGAGIVAGMMLLASSAHAQFARQEHTTPHPNHVL